MAHRAHALRADQARPWTWSWLKQWSGYVVTVLPYISAMLVLLPHLAVAIKFAILAVFAALVLTIRVLHEKAGIEVTSPEEKRKHPID